MTETQNSESAEDTDKLTVFTPFCVCFPCHTQHKHVFVFLSHTTQTCVFVSLSLIAQTCVFILPVTAQTCFCFPFHIQHKRVFLFFLSHTTQTCVCFPFTRNTNICFYCPYHTQHKHGDVFVSLCIFDFPFTHRQLAQAHKSAFYIFFFIKSVCLGDLQWRVRVSINHSVHAVGVERLGLLPEIDVVSLIR